jgi:RNA polymerase sigma-70 factor (ECF subfamily)
MDAEMARTLLRDWADGSSRAGELLVRRMSPEIYAASLRILSDRQEAEDVTQDTFVKLWENRERWQQLDDLASWLRRIAVNACFNVLKKKARLKLIDQVLPAGEEPPAPITRAEFEDASGAIDGLAETYKLPFLCRYLLGWSNTETAERLGLTPEALRVRIHRALVLLRETLKRGPS